MLQIVDDNLSSKIELLVWLVENTDKGRDKSYFEIRECAKSKIEFGLGDEAKCEVAFLAWVRGVIYILNSQLGILR